VELVFKKMQSIFKTHPNNKIYLMGDLVHNAKSLSLINTKNVCNVKDTNKLLFLKKNKDINAIIVFPAHGCDLDTLKYARKKFKHVYELTCPCIKQNIKLIHNLSSKKKKILFFGTKNHTETQAILSTNKSLKQVDAMTNFNNIKDKVYLVNQSTIPISLINSLVDNNKNIMFISTTCDATKIRHSHIANLSMDIDLLLVVGNKTSNNTMALCKLARQRGIKVKLISSQEQLNKNYFNSIDSCAVISGTSTMKEVVDAIIRKLNSFINKS
jgi:4-hydroxy-3-methylbut-2-enyl diphosphate reductase